MSTEPKPVHFEIQLTDAEAWTLARFFRGVGLPECKAAAQSDGEAYAMRDATRLLGGALADKGFSIP